MVSPDKKKNSALRRKGKAKIVEVIIDGPVQTPAKQNRAAIPAPRHASVVSAMVFDDEKNATALPRRGTLKNAASLPPVTVSAFRENPFDLTFTNKLRNVIEYTFECLRDSVADQKPMASYLERSIAEMKTLASQADRRLSLQTLRRLNELIEEVEAFARGEKTALTNTDDYQGVLHYRHYVRIAWLTHFILGDLSASGL